MCCHEKNCTQLSSGGNDNIIGSDNRAGMASGNGSRGLQAAASYWKKGA